MYSVSLLRTKLTAVPQLLTDDLSLIARRWGTIRQIHNTCLIEFHKKRQARMVQFAGYMMPVVYRDQTIKGEHLQTRNSASTFDVSHMLQTIILGKDRIKFLEKLTTADIESLSLDKSTLSMFLNNSGGIIDDCIISKRSDHIHIVSNAGNAETVWLWINKLIGEFKVKLERLSGRGLIALQGPKAAQVMQSLVDVDLSGVDFMSSFDASIKGVGVCQVTRCGYTGEDGFEISVETEKAESLMEILCQFDSVKPAGLGARDTLRLEAGLCLHGHDITDKNTPVEAALNWTIHNRRRAEGGFVGSEVVLNQIKDNSMMKRVGLMATEGGPPAREGCKIIDEKGNYIGKITSGTLSPSIEKNIAMGYIPTHLSKDKSRSLFCDIRGKKYPYTITKMPFVKTHYYNSKSKMM